MLNIYGTSFHTLVYSKKLQYSNSFETFNNTFYKSEFYFYVLYMLLLSTDTLLAPSFSSSSISRCAKRLASMSPGIPTSFYIIATFIRAKQLVLDWRMCSFIFLLQISLWHASSFNRAGLSIGASQPWPEVMKVMTGNEKMDASAIREYFKPLEEWLKKKNSAKGEETGWF